MVLEYSVVAKLNPRDMDAPKRFYAQVVNTKKYSLRMLASDISLSTSISPIDVAAVLECLLEFIPKLTTDGKAVQLGDFGSFKASLSSRGEETPEAVGRQSIRNIHFVFTPGAELKRRMGMVEYRKVDQPVKGL